MSFVLRRPSLRWQQISSTTICSTRLFQSSRIRSTDSNKQGTKCCNKKAATKEKPVQSIMSSEFWSSRLTWARASINTTRCLIGCTTGDFSAMWIMQSNFPELGMPTIMGVSSKYQIRVLTKVTNIS